jgi:phosphoglycerol transferase MdoB-like AlkP superfamily enzyme
VLTPGHRALKNRPTSRTSLVSWPGFWLLPWLVPALTSIYLKYVLMAGTESYGSGGFKIAAQSLGRKHEFGLWEKVSFFQMDVIVAALIAIALLVLTRFLPCWLRFSLVAVMSAGVTLALYAQLRAFRVVGQFLSFQMFWEAFSGGWHEPAAYMSYIGIKASWIALGLSAFGLGALGLGGLSWLFRKHAPGVVRRYRTEGGTAKVEGMLIFCLLPVSIAAWLPPLPSNPYQSSVMWRAVSAYWAEQDVETAEFAGPSKSVLLSRYREFTHAPAPVKNPIYWGRAESSNVIFFVLETMPERFLRSDGEMADLPNLRRLREKSFVGVQHFTTFPRTHEAIFSLLSSWYPSNVTRTFEEQHPNIRVPGMMAALGSAGYRTAIYSPMRRWHSLDEEMFQEVGVQEQIYPPDALAPPQSRQDLRAAWMRTRIDRDLATLELMKRDIGDCLTEERNFAAVFLPQISHFPYPELAKGQNQQDIRTQARAILKIQDAWLGELLRLLQQRHQLENTVIVVTGDHGVRTSEEDPNFTGGVIDEYSFHVPLLMYAPKALNHSVTIPWLTSHIDVAPTVLDLLGIEQGREFEQGSPIWNADLKQRDTYFFANSALGADGYYSDGRFYMRNLMSDSVYASSNQHFQAKDIVPKNSADYDQVSRALARMTGLQQVASANFSRSNKVRDHVFGSAGSRD